MQNKRSSKCGRSCIKQAETIWLCRACQRREHAIVQVSPSGRGCGRVLGNANLYKTSFYLKPRRSNWEGNGFPRQGRTRAARIFALYLPFGRFGWHGGLSDRTGRGRRPPGLAGGHPRHGGACRWGEQSSEWISPWGYRSHPVVWW